MDLTYPWYRRLMVEPVFKTQTDTKGLRPGESRVVEVLPCPDNSYTFPNEFFLLRRAAKGLIVRSRDHWNDPEWLQATMDAVAIIREKAKEFPRIPSRSWEQYGLGIVQEICCPACKVVFKVQGKFYTPVCPHCTTVLSERR
jgi:hypothetical protein